MARFDRTVKCVGCGGAFRTAFKLNRCPSCYPLYCRYMAYDRGTEPAVTAVKKAIKLGDLLPLRGQYCVDCGDPARDYDHRDYNKPLDVDPVCRSCNIRRGAAIPLVGSGIKSLELTAKAAA